MKYLLYIITIFVAVLYSSCNKPIPVYNAGTFDYKLTASSTEHVATNGTGVLYLYFQLISGYPENEALHVVISGAPTGVTLAQTDYSFKLHYGIRDSFNVYNAMKADYPISIDVSSPSTGLRHYTDTLHIDTTINRVANLAGNYNVGDHCSYELIRNCTFTPISDTSLRFMIINQRDSVTYDTTYALADNFSAAFTIPLQSASGVTVSGSGYPAYYGLKMTKNYTIGASTHTCKFDLFKEP